MVKKILEYLLILDLSYFVCFGIYNKSVVKLSLAIGAGVYILLKIIVSKKRFFIDLFSKIFLNKYIFSFLTIVLVSVLLSTNFKVSQTVLFQRYVYYFSIFFLTAYLAKTKKYFLILFLIFLSSSFIISLGGLEDLLKVGIIKAYDNLPSQLTRLYTSFRIPAFFAAYFLYTIPIFLIILFLHPRVKNKILSAIAIIPLAICLFFHFSRSTWIVLAMAVLIYFLFLNRHKWLGAFVSYLIFNVAFILHPSRVRLFNLDTLSPTTWGDRVAMWKAALNIFKAYPFFGVGPGNYVSFMYKVIPLSSYNEGAGHIHAHNIYLEIIAETGLFGIISFLLILYIFFKNMILRIKKKGHYIDVAFLIMVIAVLLGELTASTIMVGVYSACLFWFLLGLAVGRQDDTENV